MKKLTLYLVFFAVNLLSASIWSNAGLLNTFDQVNASFNVDSYSGTDDAKVASALTAAKSFVTATEGRAMVVFAGRTYNLTHSINFEYPDSNIVLQGNGTYGTGATILSFTFSGTNPSDSTCINIVGEESTTATTALSQSVNYLYKNIQAYNLTNLNEGDWFRLSDLNHPGLQTGRTGCVSQITRLASKSGNSGQMEDIATKNWVWQDASNLAIYKLDPVRNIGIENIKIIRTNSTKAVTSGGEHGTTIHLRHAVNCWIKGVHSEQTCRHHVMAYKCARLYIHGCYFHDARHFGRFGYGYGVLLTFGTTNCLIENNIFDKLRHAMVVQEGANFNVFSFNYSYKQYWMLYENELGGWEWIADFIDIFPFRAPTCGYMGVPPYCGGDICIHGNYPFTNLFEHNWVTMIVADGEHEAEEEDVANGVYNTFFRNIVYGDEHESPNAIKLHDSPDYEVGCCMSSQDRAAPIEATGNNGSNSVDYFGYYNGSSVMYGHLLFNPGGYYEYDAHYDAASLFYNSEPDFKSGYSWPAIGPKLYENDTFSNITQNIPARDRFSNSTKTYAYNLTTSLTTSGALGTNETWSNPHQLTGDVTVPTGITLTIAPSTSVNLNGHSITSTGGLIVCNTDDISPHCIRKPDSGHAYNSLGLYPTLQAALADAGSGDMISAKYDTYTLTENLTVPDSVQFKFEDNSTINLASYYIKSQSTGYLDNFADCTINPLNIYSTEGAVRKGQFPTLQNALTNAATGRGVNFGGTRTGNFTLSKRLNMIGYNASSCIDGSLTIDNVTGGYVKLENFHVTGTLTANSCQEIWCDDMLLDKTVFLNYSAGYFENSSNTETYSLTKIYGDCLYADNYEMAYNTYSCYGRLGSEIELYNCSLGGSWRGLALYYDSEAFLDESEFCANTSYDIYAASGCYADAMSVSQWTTDPATNTYGDVDYYPSGNTYCTSLSKANAVAGSEPTLFKSTACFRRTGRIQDYCQRTA